MSLFQQVITIGLAAIATMTTRFLPFFIFPENKPTPPFVKYLCDYLPPAILGILVVYCYKDALLHLDAKAYCGFISGVITVGLQMWKRNMMISILVGTAVYMLLVNYIGQ